MIFTDNQMMMFRSRASWLLSKLKEWEKHDDDTKIGFILADFQEVASMGYGIAQDRVCSTPWDWERVHIGSINTMSNNGWEYVALYVEQKDLRLAPEPYVLMRRRRAVREIIAVKKEAE